MVTPGEFNAQSRIVAHGALDVRRHDEPSSVLYRAFVTDLTSAAVIVADDVIRASRRRRKQEAGNDVAHRHRAGEKQDETHDFRRKHSRVEKKRFVCVADRYSLPGVAPIS